MGKCFTRASLHTRKPTFTVSPLFTILSRLKPTDTGGLGVWFPEHPAIEGFQRCFPPPDIETFTVNTSPFVFQSGVCCLRVAPPCQIFSLERSVGQGVWLESRHVTSEAMFLQQTELREIQTKLFCKNMSRSVPATPMVHRRFVWPASAGNQSTQQAGGPRTKLA